MECTISHIKQNIENPDEWIIQTNEEHCQGVAELASKFASEIGYGDIGEILGILHDKGKEKVDFQNYICKTSGYKTDVPSWEDKSHAYVGALIAKQLYKQLLPFLAYPIMGHHAGLHDYCDYDETLKKDVPKDVSINDLGINPTIPIDVRPEMSDFNHIIRVLFSCLVDADFLDTEKFMSPESAAQRGGKKTLGELLPLLEDRLKQFENDVPNTVVNSVRNDVQQTCRNSAVDVPGFYSLTVPTGGGKTLSSLLWAMLHAVKYGKKRIIIAIPYTSIIVQTAATLKSIFGEENVLEHHSNVDYDTILGEENVLEHHSNVDYDTSKKKELRDKFKLATENWDYPIIVTTNVQLFESMYSNKPSQCRKLHNICNSVLILDEVQTLPIEYLQPIVNGLKAYQRLFKTSVLFTTASQPVLEGVNDNPNNPSIKLNGFERVKEIIPSDFKLHDKLRRVRLHMETNTIKPDELVVELSKHKRVLCIVNTRKDAQKIYSNLPQEGLTLHLSRMMCPKHVGDNINKIKVSLKSDVEPIIRVVATQLVEAGVDIDFPVVFRQEAGLDSVLQAAGRCNREGKMDIADSYVFSLGKELPPGFLSQTNNARKNMLSRKYDWFSPEAMKEYFRQLYGQIHTFDKVDIHTLLEKPFDFMFAEAADKFKLIDDKSFSVIVNWENSLELVDRLKKFGPTYSLMRSLGQYTVNIYERDFNTLKNDGFIEEELGGIYVIRDREQYSDKIGLVVENHWLEEILIK